MIRLVAQIPGTTGPDQLLMRGDSEHSDMLFDYPNNTLFVTDGLFTNKKRPGTYNELLDALMTKLDGKRISEWSENNMETKSVTSTEIYIVQHVDLVHPRAVRIFVFIFARCDVTHGHIRLCFSLARQPPQINQSFSTGRHAAASLYIYVSNFFFEVSIYKERQYVRNVRKFRITIRRLC
jgi:hypothetical protein